MRRMSGVLRKQANLLGAHAVADHEDDVADGGPGAGIRGLGRGLSGRLVASFRVGCQRTGRRCGIGFAVASAGAKGQQGPDRRGGSLSDAERLMRHRRADHRRRGDRKQPLYPIASL
jgi:hypothetical protein